VADDRFTALLADLAAEVDALAAVVAPLDGSALGTATPAQGWDVADTLSHLAAFDDHATEAVVDPDRFRADLDELLRRGADPIAEATERGRVLGPAGCRDWWLAAAARFADAAAGLEASIRVPWYGPDMGAMSFVTARLMETWAHGQDVRDALGRPPEVSDRLRHVADIGIRARGYSYVVRGLEVPEVPVRVELVGPGGDRWTWGDEDAADRVRGGALDFCLLVTQRRHRSEVDVEADGAVAEGWLDIAQAFAGPPGPGRPPTAG
jgi:uncharacterized protein (TIGR03084 family)